MQAFIKFNKGLMAMGRPVRLWLMVLVAANLIVPVFYLPRLEAWVTIGVFFASAVLMTMLTALFGFTRVLGAGHILWIPLMLWLWTRLDAIPSDDPFGIWIRILMILNGISLVIDMADVARYIGGDRKPVDQSL